MNKTNNNFRENMEVIKKGKIPEKITSSGNTKSATLSVKLTAKENSRFTADLERSGMSSKTDYAKHRLFNIKPIITLYKGRDILEKLSEIVNLLYALNEGNSVDRQQDVRKITELLSKIEADISYICDCIDAANNGKEVV